MEFEEPLQNGFTIYSKSGCFYCTKVKKLLTDAKRPLVYIGHGVRLSQATKIFIKLIKKLQIPFVTTWTAADLFPSELPLNLGIIGMSGQRGANKAI